MMHVKMAIVAGCLLIVGNTVQAEGNWPQWRGPSRDGVAATRMIS